MINHVWAVLSSSGLWGTSQLLLSVLRYGQQILDLTLEGFRVLEMQGRLLSDLTKEGSFPTRRCLLLKQSKEKKDKDMLYVTTSNERVSLRLSSPLTGFARFFRAVGFEYRGSVFLL